MLEWGVAFARTQPFVHRRGDDQGRSRGTTTIIRGALLGNEGILAPIKDSFARGENVDVLSVEQDEQSPALLSAWGNQYRGDNMKTLRIGMGVALLIFLGTVAALAQNTYEDLSGRFMLDLPAGWKLAPQSNEYVYQFKGDGAEQVIMAYVPDRDDRTELFSNAVENMQRSAADAAPQGQVVDFEINGNPARWGIYAGTVESQGTKVNLHGLLGAVVLLYVGMFLSLFLID